MLIDGRWVGSDDVIDVLDPDDDRVVAGVAAGSTDHVEAAVAAAHRALRVRLPGHERARILAAAADALRSRQEQAARLIATEGIKTIREARAEAARAVATLQLASEEAKRATGETLGFDQYPSGVGRLGFTVREPIGVVGAITPFNDPLNLVAHKVGPALAAGNAVVLKPDSKTPLSALFLAELLMEVGLPDGYLHVIPGPGPVVGDAIARHPGIGMVSFTGGVAAGRTIHAGAGLKPVSMELGANNPVLVHHDADLSLATALIGSGAFWAAGQNCLHVQRVLAHERVFDEVADGLVKYAESTLLGPKFDEATDMGPLIDEASRRRTASIVDEAVGDGADLLTGGEAVDNSFQPTLLASVPPDSRASTEEIYAPVTVLGAYGDLEDAIRRANDTEYGLAAAVFTTSMDVAFTCASRLRAGQVMVNESTDFRIDAMPFGGGGASGLGREGVRYAIDAMTDPKVVALSGIDVPGLG
jgi:glyceraldehyde-3-phosphate dehydrogenase (NADP+)